MVVGPGMVTHLITCKNTTLVRVFVIALATAVVVVIVRHMAIAIATNS